ncbi:MAG: long-chain-fatty-acid--CoA ligase [Sciscionella sp.]
MAPYRQVDDLAMVGQGRSMSYGAQLARAARQFPDRPAFTFGDTVLSYRSLDERVNRLARALAGMGVRRGDRVAILMRNRLEYAEVLYAVARLGAIGVPINFRLVAGEVGYILGDCTPRALVVDRCFAETAALATADATAVPAVLVTDDGAAEFGADALDYDSTVTAASAEPRDIDVPETDAAYIMYTSGTTGRPKGAVLTHLNLVMAGLLQDMAMGGMRDRHGVYLLGVPMFHIAGLALSTRAALSGTTVVIYGEASFNPERIVDLFESERVTGCFFVPAQWATICAVPGIKDRDLVLDTISWGAAVAPPSVLDAMADAFPAAPAYCAFGQTEMSPTTCMLRGEDAAAKLGSVGKPLPGIEVRIVDEELRDVPEGSVGEIVYRGPTTMREYWNKPEATEEAFRGGWFHSGDLVRRDPDGFIWVVDRKKDMIISGGENIYCAEVEAAIDGHPKVAEVAVIGREDERWGQVPVAVLAPHDPADPPDLAEIRMHCAQSLASYKHPKALTVVNALPRNASGKVQKFVLRDDDARRGKRE